MAIEKNAILAAMAGKISPEDAGLVADVLCRDPAAYHGVTVVDDSGFEPDDGAPESAPMLAPCRPAEHRRPCMIGLPSRLFIAPWLRGSLRARLGPVEANAFYAEMHRLGDAAKEPAYLAAVLREAYGPSGLPALADAAVFAQPDYAPFRRDVLPVLEKYIY